MKKKMFYPVLVLPLLLVFTQVAIAEMQSDNYRIPTCVFSGGGMPADSTHYHNDATLGQPSPLMNPYDPPSSPNYNLEPGFWYTVASAEVCECDLNLDGRCDMQDWLLFGADWGRTDCGTPPGSGDPPNDCECDLNIDGKCDMQDWLVFGEDWGRTDCPLSSSFSATDKVMDNQQ